MPENPQAKSTIKIVFLTLFIDLVGFSIIFPLFPAMIQHYTHNDANDPALGCILSLVTGISHLGGVAVTDHRMIVLFGGILSGIYSLLQFIFAPLWGRLSDRHGRKPVLITTIAGTAVSYLLWIFSGSFSLLVVARFLGGIMAGNISTATAVVGDVTSSDNRSRGMAVIGIAFGMGFLFGPALGGLLSTINLAERYPALAAYGINPFSVPALFAFALSVINLFSVLKTFRETLAPELRGKTDSGRSINPVKLFTPLPFPGVNLVNFTNLIFLLAFAGMEGTLTFLTLERFEFTPRDNGMLFVFIGIIGALVQGGFVRRRARVMGEDKMVLTGLVLLIPGLILTSLSFSTWQLYAALALLAIGSALVIPCLAALVSLFSPPQNQGEAIGVFRSMGALARALGPFAACVLYWRYGAKVPFFIEALLIGVAFVLMVRVRKLGVHQSQLTAV